MTDRATILRIVRAVSALFGCCGNLSGQREAVIHLLRKLDSDPATGERLNLDVRVTPLEEIVLAQLERSEIVTHDWSVYGAGRTELGELFLRELTTPTLCRCGESLLNHHEAGADGEWAGDGDDAPEHCIVICTNGVTCYDFEGAR